MTALEFVNSLSRQTIDNSCKIDVVEAMIAFYCRFLSEDPQEGSDFDCNVIDALECVLRRPDIDFWRLKRALPVGHNPKYLPPESTLTCSSGSPCG